MNLFFADRASTQQIIELSEQRLSILPYEEDADYYQWIFEICKIESGAQSRMSIFALLDAFLASIELSILQETHESKLREVDQGEARKILRYVLSQSLAYKHSTGLTEQQVDAIIDQFFQIFATQPHYFTNADFEAHPFRLSAFWPITIHVVDIGLLLVDEQRIGILWATDDD